MKSDSMHGDGSTSVRPRPDEYGLWWNTNDVGLEWYKKIYEFRSKTHRFFQEWFEEQCKKGQFAESVLEVGCGRGLRGRDDC